MKKCKKCLEVKNENEFYKHSQMKDGLLNFCKSCVIVRVSSYWYKNVEIHRIKERERWQRRKSNPNEIERRKKYNRDWYAKDKNRCKSHGAVHRKLKPKEYCEICGIKAKMNAHHDNYEKPLEVLWCCVLCHRKIHNKNK